MEFAEVTVFAFSTPLPYGNINPAD